jgi:SAM-dependent methyltransferase
VLDLGGGTGAAACLLAGQYQARVTALDLRAASAVQTRQRARQEGLESRVDAAQADAHNIPAADAAFSLAVAESVLVFCRAQEVCTEICRALKPGGAFCCNELTLLGEAPAELAEVLREWLGIRAYSERGWLSVLERAGFTDAVASVHRISLWEQLGSHLQVDGVRGYLASARRGIGDAPIRRSFFNRRMLSAAVRFLPHVGYGIYTARKP